MDGLSELMGQEITLEGGAVMQHNYDEHLDDPHGASSGSGSPLAEDQQSANRVGRTCPAPDSAAVCNAIFSATGKRIRETPLSSSYAGHREPIESDRRGRP